MGAYVHEGVLDRRIAELADQFYGIVDVEQLRSVGATRRQIGVRLESGRLIRLHRGVYAVGHRRLTPRGWWLAAVRAIGSGAALSNSHGAALWNLRPPPGGRINVTVLSRGRRQRKGIRVHPTLDLPPEHVTVHEGIPVTTPERTLSDLAATVDTPALARALEEAEKQRLLDLPSLLAVCAGRPGARRIRRLTATELPKTRSELEAAFVELCRRHRLPRPVMNAELHGYELDAYWPDHGLVAEIDSWLHHGTRAAFERDRTRDADLQALGLATVRFTDEQVTKRDAWVSERLRAALRFRRGSSSSRRSAA